MQVSILIYKFIHFSLKPNEFLSQDPTEDTQWNDALRKKGILPPKAPEAEVTEEQIENMIDSVVKNHTSDSKQYLTKFVEG